jgi:hypothetical protein
MGVPRQTTEAAPGLAQIVRDAIAAQDRDGAEVLRRGLQRAGEAVMPEALEDMLVFVCGPLYEEALAHWGNEAADALLAALTPLLEEAWKRDRRAITGVMPSEPAPEESGQRRSAVRRAVALPADSTRAQADTEPAPPPSISSNAPCSQKRVTIPYTPVIWRETRRVAVLVVARDEVRRASLGALCARPEVEVVLAGDAGEAAALYARLLPLAVVADRESIAPDYEPLRPALEQLFGGHPPCGVLLLCEEEPREQVDWIAATLPERPARDELQAEIALLLDG